MKCLFKKYLKLINKILLAIIYAIGFSALISSEPRQVPLYGVVAQPEYGVRNYNEIIQINGKIIDRETERNLQNFKVELFRNEYQITSGISDSSGNFVLVFDNYSRSIYFNYKIRVYPLDSTLQNKFLPVDSVINKNIKDLLLIKVSKRK